MDSGKRPINAFAQGGLVGGLFEGLGSDTIRRAVRPFSGGRSKGEAQGSRARAEGGRDAEKRPNPVEER